MKQYLIALMIALGGLALIAPEADARRLGGGGSFGKQSQSFGRAAPAQRNTPSQATSQNQARQQGAAANSSPWRGLLGGALLGLGLGALLSHFGIGGALASFIATALMVGLLVLLAMFVYRLLRGKNAAPAYAGGHHAGSHYGGTQLQTPEIGARLEPHVEPRADPVAFQDRIAGSGAAVAAEPVGTIPADFDVPAFVRN
ncbi:MAG TPA: hypothetical protein VIG66_03940, partial [Noviherbaspirillum sp.]